MLLTQFLNNLRPRGRFVAKHFATNRLLECPDQVWREAVGKSRQRLVQNDPSHLPMTRRTIFPRRRLCHLAIRPFSITLLRGPKNRRNVSQSNPPQVGQFQPANGLSAVFQRTGSLISVG